MHFNVGEAPILGPIYLFIYFTLNIIAIFIILRIRN